MALPIRFRATVENVIRHTPDVASYRLYAEKRLPRFVPGQFIHLTLEPFDPASFWPESRVFSVANAVTDRRTVELTISRQGDYTSKILDNLQEGEQVWCKGPYGDFTIDASHGYPHIILVAGGTGVTPFGAFMDAAINQGKLPVEQATLHYGAQTPGLLIYRGLAERCAAEVPGFQVRFYADHGGDEIDGAIRPGRIDLATIIAETANPAATAFYLSGPQVMIQDFQRKLVEQHGISAQQIFVDAWE